MRNRNGSRGVTLIELCFGLTIVAILTALAVPSFREAMRAGAVRSATLELLAGVQQTRASSIVEARPGTLCLSGAAGECLRGNGPASSWQAFLKAGDRRLPLAARTLPAGVLLRASRPQLEFWPDAFAASTITLTICDIQGVAPSRAIVVSQSGRVRLGAATDAGCAR
jgi:type IV fimbrial biogenesis protein FimT